MSNSTTVKTDTEEEVVRADNPPSTTRRKRVVKRNIETVPEEPEEEEPEPETRGSRYETLMDQVFLMMMNSLISLLIRQVNELRLVKQSYPLVSYQYSPHQY